MIFDPVGHPIEKEFFLCASEEQNVKFRSIEQSKNWSDSGEHFEPEILSTLVVYDGIIHSQCDPQQTWYHPLSISTILLHEQVTQKNIAHNLARLRQRSERKRKD